ncbi:MAG: hypothetical protein R3335_07170, partial [Anaerolineales bacterium]|nr:hypothetical protein [Anaerolineales bacterium]
ESYCAAAVTDPTIVAMYPNIAAEDNADGVNDCRVPRAWGGGAPIVNWDSKMQALQDYARLPSIRDVAYQGAVAILQDNTVDTSDPANETVRGWLKISVCSNRPGWGEIPADPSIFRSYECIPRDDPGRPGDLVVVAVDYTHPLISPLISQLWPVLRLSSQREGIVEQFRRTRVINLPPTVSGPTATASQTPVPTNTPTFTPTNTPTNTNTPTDTATPTNTPTNTPSPTPSPTPDCNLINTVDIWASNDDILMSVRNDNPGPMNLTISRLDWPSVLHADGTPDTNAYVNWFSLGGNTYYSGNSGTSPTIINSSPGPQIGGTTTSVWRMDFGSYSSPLTLGANAVVTLTFNPGNCVVSGTLYPVEVEIVEPPVNGTSVSDRADTRWEAEGWDLGVGTFNGAGVARIRFELYDPIGNLITNRSESVIRYCAFGGGSPDCSMMGSSMWNSLVNGTYTLRARTEGDSGVWSPWEERTIIINKAPTPTPTITWTPTITLTPSRTPTASPFTPGPTATNTRTPTQPPATPTRTNTPKPTRTNTPAPTRTNTPTATTGPPPSNTPPPATNTFTPPPNSPTPTLTPTPTPTWCSDC